MGPLVSPGDQRAAWTPTKTRNWLFERRHFSFRGFFVVSPPPSLVYFFGKQSGIPARRSQFSQGEKERGGGDRERAPERIFRMVVVQSQTNRKERRRDHLRIRRFTSSLEISINDVSGYLCNNRHVYTCLTFQSTKATQ